MLLRHQNVAEQLLLGGAQLLGELDVERHQHVALSRRVFGEGQPIAGDPFDRVRLDDLVHRRDAQLLAVHRGHLEDDAAQSLQSNWAGKIWLKSSIYDRACA